MILPQIRDPRFILVRRGGTLVDGDHRLLASWAARCAEHILPYFEAERPEDPRPRVAIELALAWARREIPVNQAKAGAYHANAAARDLRGAAKYAALSAGQAAAVAHVAAHELGAAAYAIRAAMPADGDGGLAENGRKERRWQLDQLPDPIKSLVMEDMVNRNHLCWNVFGD